MNSNGHRVSRCRSWYETRIEWYESIPDSAECLAGHSSLAHGLNDWRSAIYTDNPTLVAHFITEHEQHPDRNHPLHLAVHHNSSIAAIVLIENGANVNLKDQSGNAPLHFAAGRTDTAENAEMISLLLVGGADPNIRNRNNWTPLDLAYHGGQIRLTNGKFASNPRRLAMAALVAGGGGLANPNLQDNNGDSPLHLETRAGRKEFVLWLLERGANPDIANDKSETPLHQAASDFSFPIVKLLTDRGANPDVQDTDSESPLHKISRGEDSPGNAALISLLLDKDANPNLKNNAGWRPLDLAFDDGGQRECAPCTANTDGSAYHGRGAMGFRMHGRGNSQ